MTRKLTQATVPMCPKCDAEMRASKWPDDSGTWTCDQCQHFCGRDKCNLGFYAPDSAGVVVEIREYAKVERANGRECAAEIHDGWADELEEKS